MPNIKVTPLKWLPGKFIAIAIYPNIYIRDEAYRRNKVLINHEKIHLAQQEELGIFKFMILYVWEFLTRLGYRNISFEREAYANERDMKYLENRAPKAHENY